MLLSDFGGFQGAIIMIPYFFMSYYSSKMLANSITAKIPARSNKIKKKDKASTTSPSSVIKKAQKDGLK